MITPVMQYKRPSVGTTGYASYGPDKIIVKSKRIGGTARERKMTEPEHTVWFRGECVGEVYRGSRGWVYQHADVPTMKRIQWRYDGYGTRREAAWQLVVAVVAKQINSR